MIHVHCAAENIAWTMEKLKGYVYKKPTFQGVFNLTTLQDFSAEIKHKMGTIYNPTKKSKYRNY